MARPCGEEEGRAAASSSSSSDDEQGDSTRPAFGTTAHVPWWGLPSACSSSGGSRSSHYAPVHRIGGGAFGEVHAGCHLPTGAAVALKRVVVHGGVVCRTGGGLSDDDFAGSKDAAATRKGGLRLLPDNVLRELKTMQHVSSSGSESSRGDENNVVRLLDHFASGRAVTLVMELCPVGDLGAILLPHDHEDHDDW